MLNHVLIWGQGIEEKKKKIFQDKALGHVWSAVERQKKKELHVTIIPTFPTK